MSETPDNEKKGRWLEYVIINYRWVLVIFFLLPASFFYDLYSYFRSWIVFKANSAPKTHQKKVKEVQAQVKDWILEGQRVPMCTARPGWQTICFRQGAYKKTLYNVDINMVDILEIDVKKRTVRCEPLVTMGQLTHILLELGWTIPMVPELDELTVGGLVMGTGIESTSHKEGLFQHICVSFELVLADGSVVTCSENENPDLFYCVPWSYGTLGFLTAAEIRIIPADRFIRLSYRPCLSHEDLLRVFAEEAQKKEGNEFVEGLMFSINSGVIMTGIMTNSAEPGKLNAIGTWHKPWFFKHVEEIMKRGEVTVEYIPLRDYYHRHSRSIFWEMQDIIPFGNKLLFRYLLGWMMPIKVSFLKLTQGETLKRLYEDNHIFQDMLVPISAMSEALRVFDKEVKVYPLWLCPFKLPQRPGMLRVPQDQEALFVDVGIYGVPKVPDCRPVQATRNLEAFVLKVKGFQMLYADSYLTREEFRQMFDHSLYDKLRHDLDCHKAFPEIYDKVNRSARI